MFKLEAFSIARGLLTPPSMSQFHVPNITEQELRHRYGGFNQIGKPVKLQIKKLVKLQMSDESPAGSMLLDSMI